MYTSFPIQVYLFLYTHLAVLSGDSNYRHADILFLLSSLFLIGGNGKTANFYWLAHKFSVQRIVSCIPSIAIGLLLISFGYFIPSSKLKTLLIHIFLGVLRSLWSQNLYVIAALSFHFC